MAKINTMDFTKIELLDQVQALAEKKFRDGTFFCSESVVSVLNEYLDYPYSDEVVRLASSFPIGMGKAQCLCGAVSGGQMVLGMSYGRVEGESMNPKMFPVAKALHDHVVKDYGATCCRVITRQWNGDNFASPERKNHCIHITGDVARWVAERLIDDGKLAVKDFTPTAIETEADIKNWVLL
ncbi:MAG: C-GCAxxG-C-C family protein [Clostridiaceae bacterium]